jgi:signal transduction histidine kinase/DNA-binding LytR/AlgR family response regulator
MIRNNSILHGLIALLLAFVLGYMGIIFIHLVFKDIVEKLDTNVKNEYARYKIGEYILKEISSIETHYYKMGILTNIKSIKPMQEEIKKEIEDVKKAINVLNYGGEVNSYIKLNILDIDETTDVIKFTPSLNQKFTFEAIDLLPKLKELENKSSKMEDIMKIKINSNNATNDELFKVELFFKQLPTLFTRMKENANRLLYDSKKNISKLESSINKEKKYYENLEYIFTYFIVFLIIILGYLLIKQITKKNKELEAITLKAKQSEQEALKANETKSQFLANMSHEIRTPLNAIIGFSDILANTENVNKQKDKALVISRSAKALLNIINDILDISKIESGKFEISESSFNLKLLLEQVVQLYAVNTKQKDIRFLYRLEDSIPEYVISDDTKLKQVLSNILSNAIKFTPQNKKVTFDVSLINKTKNTAKIRFSIKDEGIGISKEEQKKIFEPFSQADGSISRKFGGTGLGLAISLKIVQLFGSEIKLNSEIDKGSVFYFDIDFEVENKLENILEESKYNFAICNIIEDPENIREHLKNIVKNFGNIHVGDDIDKQEHLDLIFCFGDPQFYEKLKGRKEKFKCPVVYVGQMKKMENNIMKHLMDYYLDVPIYGSKIFNIIAEVKSIEKTNKNLQSSDVKYIGKILVAEDNTNNQLLMDLILKDFGLDVTIVDNGELAFMEYQKNNYDIVFMDINMPIMDGLTSLKLIRNYEQISNNHTPIIALTANAIEGDREKYIKEGMDGYLSKPIDNQELVKILDKYLEIENNCVENLSIENISSKLGVSDKIANMLVEKFKLSIKEDMKELNDFVEANSIEEISKKAHYIKNSCLNIGLDKSCEILDELEKADSLSKDEIHNNFELLKKEIKKYEL